MVSYIGQGVLTSIVESSPRKKAIRSSVSALKHRNKPGWSFALKSATVLGSPLFSFIVAEFGIIKQGLDADQRRLLFESQKTEFLP